MSLIPRVFDPFSFNLHYPFHDLQLSSSGDSEAVYFAIVRIAWKETTEVHVFKVVMPRLKNEEVKSGDRGGNVLQISGKRSREKKEKSDTWHRVERISGKFRRRFHLPENANLDQIKASMENGMLNVVVPKEEVKKHEVKAIDI